MARQRCAGLVVANVLLCSIGVHSGQQLTVSVRLQDFGVARGNGVAAITVFVSCSGGTVVEALLTLSQDDQAIFGQTGIGPPTCDGNERRYVALVPALDGRFHAGPSFASAYVLVCGEVDCVSDGASDTVTLRGRPQSCVATTVDRQLTRAAARTRRACSTSGMMS